MTDGPSLDEELEELMATAAEGYADEHLDYLLEDARQRLRLPAGTPQAVLLNRLGTQDARVALLGAYQRPSRPRWRLHAANLTRQRDDRALRYAACAIEVHAHAVSRGVPTQAAQLLAGLAVAQWARTDTADDARRPGPWSWRRWELTGRLDRCGYALGVHAGAGWRSDVTGGWYTITWRAFRWTRRPYVLGWPIEKWRCLLRYRHWPYCPNGSPVAFGLCGRCVPWPCCGSIEQEHAADCTDPADR